MRAHRHHVVSIFLLIALALGMAGCKDDPVGPSGEQDPTGPIYLDYTTPDNLVQNFITAWESKDIAEYGDHILYDKATAVVWEEGSRDFAPFTFYFVAGVDQWGEPLPDYQTYEVERLNAQLMFSGNEGRNGTPGVSSIDLEMTAQGDWSAPDDDLIEGDAWPAGTKQRIYATDLTVMIVSNIPDGPDINGFLVDGRLQFWAIPVRVEGGGSQGYHREYRLWKWQDLEGHGYRSGRSTWSSIKSLYLGN